MQIRKGVATRQKNVHILLFLLLLFFNPTRMLVFLVFIPPSISSSFSERLQVFLFHLVFCAPSLLLLSNLCSSTFFANSYLLRVQNSRLFFLLPTASFSSGNGQISCDPGNDQIYLRILSPCFVAFLTLKVHIPIL